jgi:hypothetical protein
MIFPRLSSQRDVLPPATADQIDDFEAKLGKALPADYREFLLTWNGATFNNLEAVPYFPIDYENPEVPVPRRWFQGDSDAFVNSGKRAKKLDCLYGIGDSERYNLPVRETSYYFDLWVPDDFLAIGEPSDSVCRICLDLREETFGAIYYWYYPEGKPEPYDEAPTIDDLYWVAPSFTAFWDSLVELPDDDWERWN